MTTQTIATLKGYFNTGDVPTETHFSDFIETAVGSDNIVGALAAAASPGTANAFITANDYITRVDDDVLINSAATNDWWLATGTGSFFSHDDDLLFLGYNITGQGGRRVNGDYVWYMGFEVDYYTGTATHQAEWYIRYNDNDTVRLPLAAHVFHDTHLANVTVGGEFKVVDESNAEQFNLGRTGILSFSGVDHKILSNGTANFFMLGGGRIYLSANGHDIWCSDTATALWWDDIYIYKQSTGVLNTGSKFTSDTGLGAGNSAANTNTPSGATARQLPFYAADGTALLGYIPIYGSAW
jgi:hypothetical protein